MKKPLTLSKILYKYVIPTCGIILISTITLVGVIVLIRLLFATPKGY